jgi:hypothetical protein
LRRRDEQRQRKADRRKQAELITGYWDKDNLQYVFINGSQGSVYGLGVVLEYRLTDHPVAGTSHIDFEGEQTLPPGAQKAKKGELRPRNGEPYKQNQIAGGWKLTLVFTDQAGVHWRREPDGALVETKDTPRDFLLRKGGEQVELRRKAAQRAQAVREKRAQKPTKKTPPLEPGIVSSAGDPMPNVGTAWTIRCSGENRYNFLLVPFGAAGKIEIVSARKGYTFIPDGQPVVDGGPSKPSFPQATTPSAGDG